MYKIIKIGLFIIVLSAILFSQELDRSQRIQKLKTISLEIEQLKIKFKQMESEQEKLLEKVISIDEKDIEEASRVGAEVERIFPDEILQIAGIGGPSFSEYFFSDNIFDYPPPTMLYQNSNLEIIIDNKSEVKNYGLIANIGGTLIETINKENKAVQTASEYTPSKDIKDFTGKFSSNGITFLTKANVTVGSTYIVKVFQYESGNAIYAIKVHKKDEDGSIVIFIKSIDSYRMPKDVLNKKNITRKRFCEQSDDGLYAKIETIMNQKGFYNVSIDIKNGVVILRGSVPKGKMADAIMSANEAKPCKIENQLTEDKNL